MHQECEPCESAVSAVLQETCALLIGMLVVLHTVLRVHTPRLRGKTAGLLTICAPVMA